jgi:hypothetical protein
MAHPIRKRRNRGPLSAERAIRGPEVGDYRHSQAGREQSGFAKLQTALFGLAIVVKYRLTVASYRRQGGRVDPMRGEKLGRSVGKNLTETRVPSGNFRQLPIQSARNRGLRLLGQIRHAAREYIDFARESPSGDTNQREIDPICGSPRADPEQQARPIPY